VLLYTKYKRKVRAVNKGGQDGLKSLLSCGRWN